MSNYGARIFVLVSATSYKYRNIEQLLINIIIRKVVKGKLICGFTLGNGSAHDGVEI